MQVVKITPRGYCHGVVSALQIVSNALKDYSIEKPIYILGQIVHNINVTKAFTQAGAITLEGINREIMIDNVDKGTVIVTAHGISPMLIKKAKDKGLNVIDATCTDVLRTHDLIREYINNEYELLYIGKLNHPEPEGAIGINKDKIHLITSIEDLHKIDIEGKVCITNQTTMSMWDVEDIINEAKLLFKDIEVLNEICPATSERQLAIKEQENDIALTFVVGDKNSNNTNRLVSINNTFTKSKAYRIDTIEDIDIDLLKKFHDKKVSVSSGASTPTIITTEVIEFLNNFDMNNLDTWDNKSKVDLRRIIPRK
ncbi:MAG: 4-hydroxy-3-methylbut-2-enyl diphosphate reductase [Mycoplasmatales bacterium]